MVLLRIWRKNRFVLISLATAILVFGYVLDRESFPEIFIYHPVNGSLFSYLFFLLFQLLDLLFMFDQLDFYLRPTMEMKIRGFQTIRKMYSFFLSLFFLILRTEILMLLLMVQFHCKSALNSVILIFVR